MARESDGVRRLKTNNDNNNSNNNKITNILLVAHHDDEDINGKMRFPAVTLSATHQTND